ncbi:MAG: hypothetical protein MI861_09470, partial [Pirellulales bacterium]|nr:hypothetical protein [Pirellulales bacterium]
RIAEGDWPTRKSSHMLCPQFSSKTIRSAGPLGLWPESEATIPRPLAWAGRVHGPLGQQRGQGCDE